jgi:hypothetical protein
VYVYIHTYTTTHEGEREARDLLLEYQDGALNVL